MTIAEAIYNAARQLSGAGITNARLDAEVLLSHVMQKDRVWLIAHDKEPLALEHQEFFDGAISRRSRREPLQYITRRQEFWGLEFSTTPDVLIPRPETELLVEAAVEIIRSRSGQMSIVDLCTGSGCVAVSLAWEKSAARIFASDASGRALEVARENARRHGVAGRIRFLEGDLFGPLEELDLRGRIDIITANPPYIRSSDWPELQPEVKDFEPSMALLAGPDGTEIHERIIVNAPRFLNPDGALIMEMGIGQSELLSRMLEAAGAYGKPDIVKDLAGIDRVIVAKKR